jgi:hypothetical protein
MNTLDEALEKIDQLEHELKIAIKALRLARADIKQALDNIDMEIIVLEKVSIYDNRKRAQQLRRLPSEDMGSI